MPDLELNPADEPLYNEVKQFSTAWAASCEIQSAFEIQLADLRKQLEEEFAPQLKQVAETTDQLKALKDKIQQHVTIGTLTSERRQYMQGTVRTSLLRRPGEYDTEELKAWATKRNVLAWRLPKDAERLEQIIALVAKHAPELLEFDADKTAKTAISATRSGFRIYPDAPVEVTTECTNMSDKTMEKLLGTLLIESEFDAK